MQSTIRQVDRMNGLIKNLMMITKSREIESKAAASKINVSDIVAETAKEFSAMAEKEGKIDNVISVISKRFSSERISLAVLLTSHAFHKLLL